MIKYCYELHKNIYPIDDTPKKEICFMGEVKKFKSLFKYQTVKQISRHFKIKPDIEILKVFNLENDPRFFENGEFTNRRWNGMSLHFQMRATAALFYLTGVRTFSFPLYNRLDTKHKLNILHTIAFWVKLKQFISKNGVLLLSDEFQI